MSTHETPELWRAHPRRYPRDVDNSSPSLGGFEGSEVRRSGMFQYAWPIHSIFLIRIRISGSPFIGSDLWTRPKMLIVSDFGLCTFLHYSRSRSFWKQVLIQCIREGSGIHGSQLEKRLRELA